MGSKMVALVGVVGVVFVVVASLVATTHAANTHSCVMPLGMESRDIPDVDVKASSSFNHGNVGPDNARVRTETKGGAWCPKEPITMDPKEWLEINLHHVHLITATETQGRFGNGQGLEFTEAYLLEYFRPKIGRWVRYRDSKGTELIQGNANTYLESKRELDPPIWATKIRFIPYSNYKRTVCMRVEIYGCPWNEGVMSYSMPQGDVRGSGWEFYDASYDGVLDGELSRGLGLLTDGKVGPDNFKKGHYDLERGQGWVGWRNDSRPKSNTVEIKFEFDRVRYFNAVHIYCNNKFSRDVRMPGEVNVMFSVGGRHNIGEPITFRQEDERIFEYSKNISINLHRRYGRYVTLRLHFAAKWIMISEVTFDSNISYENFTIESAPEVPVERESVIVEKEQKSVATESPINTERERDYMRNAIIIGGSVVCGICLVFAVIFIGMCRFYHQRQESSGHSETKGARSHLSNGYSTSDRNCVPDLEDIYSKPLNRHAISTATMTSLPRHHGGVRAQGTLYSDGIGLKVEQEYQEPYHANEYAPYYSYSPVVSEMREKLSNPPSDATYDYAVPEIGTMPLLSQPPTPIHTINADTNGKYNGSLFSKGSATKGRKSKYTKGKKSPTPSHEEVMTALMSRVEMKPVAEFPRHRLRMLSKLSHVANSTMHVAEADGIPEFGSTASVGKRLVAVKSLLNDASEKEKMDFHRDTRILATIEDPNIARVLGMCRLEEPMCAIMEYLDYGDLNQYLKSHIPAGTTHHSLPLAKTLSLTCLLYMASQIASGMRYLESITIVHSDISTRNCLVGKAHLIKLSDFGTHNELYAADYYKIDGVMALPLRWMAWESVFHGRNSMKSDVWSFGVTLWEMLNLCREQPFEDLTNAQVIENLSFMHREDREYVNLARPQATPCKKDIYELMLECWRHHANERPSFREIHLFLQRKTLGYHPTT